MKIIDIKNQKNVYFCVLGLAEFSFNLYTKLKNVGIYTGFVNLSTTAYYYYYFKFRQYLCNINNGSQF